MIEVEVHNTDVEIVNEISVESTGNVTAEVVDLGDLDITVAKKEYVITGDSIYVPVLYEDAPQWMKDLVSLTVDVSIETANASTLAQLSSILATFAISYVPLNQYTQNINSLALADTNMQAVIETLNSNFNDGLNLANSQIINLQTTKAGKTEVVTQVIDTLAAQLTTPDSDIGAVISNINQAIANEATARANSFNVLNTSLGNVGENVAGNSTAISGLQSSVTNINGTLSAQAGQITTLSNNLQSGSGTWANADTAVTNTLNSNITNGLATVESKWAYNSAVKINGVYKKSGFGLTTNYVSGSGTQADPYVSEFWIDASRFKFTNSNQTGSKAPFSIDASGVTPEIYFNGKVSFSNVTGYTPPDVSGSISNNNDVFAQKLGYANYQAMVNAAASDQTVINGGYINTSLISAGAITADKIDANAISGKTISGGIITGTKLYGTQIEGAIIKASYIDLSSTATLTNWQQYTPATYPSSYDANFAKNNNGTLLVDSQGYVRLMGNTNITTESVYMTSSIGSGYNYLTPVSVNIHSYDAYSVNTLNRVITSTPTFETTSQTIITLSSHYDWDSTHQVYLKVYLLGRLYEITSTRYTSRHTGEGSGSTVVYKDGTLVHNGTSGNYTQTTYTDTVTVGKLGFSIIANSSSNGDGVGITVSSIYTSSVGNSSFTGVANTFLNILSGYSYCSSNSYPGNAVISTVNIPSVKVV